MMKRSALPRFVEVALAIGAAAALLTTATSRLPEASGGFAPLFARATENAPAPVSAAETVLDTPTPGAETARAEPAALTPRVYLPFQARDYAAVPPPDGRVGVSDRTGFAVAKSPQSLNLLYTGGIRWNRTSVSWANIEPENTTPDHFDWDTADAALVPLFDSGIEPLVLILNSPTWAASTNCGPVYDPAALAEFVGAVVARYPKVRYWALFNEVDGAVYSIYQASSGGCFGEPDLDGNGQADYADYAELMRVTWKALHTANPNAQLVFAVLAYDNFTPASAPPGYPGGCCFNYHFLDDLLKYMQEHPLPPGDRYADVLGFNDYLAYNLAYWNGQDTGMGVEAKANYLRKIMGKYGFDFPLVITEMSSWPTEPSAEGVPQRTQARQAVQMFAQAFYAEILFTVWWTWDDYPDEDCQVNVKCDVFKYGLVDVNLKPKLSYYAVQNLVNELYGWEPARSKITNNHVELVFKKGSDRKHVVYALTNTFEDKTVNVTFKAERVRVVDMMGQVSVHRDEGGKGRVRLRIDADPRYVEINPK
jgi:hypothetical protein